MCIFSATPNASNKNKFKGLVYYKLLMNHLSKKRGEAVIE